jgi:hypothetical protein
MDNNFDNQAPNQQPLQTPEQTLPQNTSAPMQSTPAVPPQPPAPADDHHVRTAVLWFLSPFMVFVGALVVSIAFRLVGVSSPFVNIVVILCGLVGMVLLVAGPIMGIIKLTRR